MNLFDEIRELQGISASAEALIKYSLSLEDLNILENKSKRYVLSPHNFATFTVHSSRANNLAVSLRGNPEEFELQPELDLVKDQNGYSSFKLKTVKELAAAANYIRRAHELYSRGRTRPILTPKTIER